VRGNSGKFSNGRQSEVGLSFCGPCGARVLGFGSKICGVCI